VLFAFRKDALSIWPLRRSQISAVKRAARLELS
jgi:hypothetical protein